MGIAAAKRDRAAPAAGCPRSGQTRYPTSGMLAPGGFSPAGFFVMPSRYPENLPLVSRARTGWNCARVSHLTQSLTQDSSARTPLVLLRYLRPAAQAFQPDSSQPYGPASHAMACLELHLLERRPAEQAVGTRQGLGDLEMVVAFADEELHGLSRRLQRGGELARLALELRGLEGSVGDDDRRAQPVEAALGAQGLLHLVGELHIAAARGQAHRLEIEHTAAEQRSLDDAGGKIEVFTPVAAQRDPGEMGARRMSGEMDALGVAAEGMRVAIAPGERAAPLLRHRQQAAARLEHVDEVRHHEMRARIPEKLRGVGVVVRKPSAPGAAVDVDVHRRVRAPGPVDVERFDRRGAVGLALRRAEALARAFAVDRVAALDLPKSWRVGALVRRRLQLRPVQVQPEPRPLGTRRLLRERRRACRQRRAEKKSPGTTHACTAALITPFHPGGNIVAQNTSSPVSIGPCPRPLRPSFCSPSRASASRSAP